VIATLCRRTTNGTLEAGGALPVTNGGRASRGATDGAARCVLRERRRLMNEHAGRPLEPQQLEGRQGRW